MVLDDIKKELETKQRTVNDLIRYIVTRTDHNPNYSLLLGSGCSVTSGVRPASQLIREWRREIYCNCEETTSDDYTEEKAIKYLQANCSKWYNSSNEYSSLFEKKYDLPKQRRMFVEKESGGALPSIGYAYLTSLVKGTYFNTIFTTNFDDLVNEAFYQFTDVRPIVCAHDSSIKSVTVTSKRPKIIKLHGDYLFDDIKSTLRETESLEENIKNKLIEFLKDYGLIVVGYSGCDRSIMDVLNYLLRQEDYLKNGIYWCIRKGDTVSEDLRKLLWKDKVYYVEIDGYDELCAQIYNEINGNKLPIDTNLVSNKSREIIDEFLKNDHLKDTKSTIIKEHLSELKKHSEKNHYYDILKKNDKYDEGGNSDRDYSDKEFIMIMDVKNSTGTGAYEEVISKSKEYERKSDNKNFKVEIYGYLIDAYVKLNLLDDAINVSDKLIDLDKKNPIFLLQKSNLIEGYDEKIKLIDAAIARDEYFYSTYLDKANLYEQKYYNLHMQDDFNEICRLYETSLKRDPSLRNPGWNGYCNFIEKSNIEKKEKENRISDIIVTMSDQNPLSIRVFKARLTLLKLGDKNAEAINSLLKEITDAKNVMPDHALLSYDIMYLSVLDYANYVDKIKDYLEVTDSNNSYKKKSKYQKYKASLVARKFGNIDEAIDILEKSLLVDTDTDSVVRIIKYLCYKSDIKKAEEVFDKYHRSMELGQRFVSRREIYEEKGDYDSAILEVKNTQKHADFSESLVTHMSYLLLLKKDYKSAKELCREYLEKVKFSQHAVSETINYEYASSMFKDGKVNKVRLQTIFDKNEDNLTRAAIKFLFSEKDECFKYINKAIAEDKTSKYLIRNWPIFSSLIGDTRWLALYS